MSVLILSDLHLGARRQGGTTMESRAALTTWQFDQLEKALVIPHDMVVINGDLFDKYSVSDKVILKTYNILKDEVVVINRGNHDSLADKYGEICSLQLLAELLPYCTLIFDEPEIVQGMHFIPHCFNQEEFDRHVSAAIDSSLVFIHANNDNNFAVEPDHSLNLSRTQRRRLTDSGCHVVLGHEHKAVMKKNFTILGCTSPTSVADCLSGDKYAYTIEADEITKHKVFSASEDFIVLPFDEMRVTDHKFVRVEGECELEVLPEVLRNFKDLRNKSNAFVVTNNVKPIIAGRAEIGEEEVTSFNILELLLEQIPEQFREEVKSCF